MYRLKSLSLVCLLGGASIFLSCARQPKITMTAKTGMRLNTISIIGFEAIPVRIELKGTGTAVINWGIGAEKQTVDLSDNRTVCSHAYYMPLRRKITITGDNITSLHCPRYKELTALDVSKNPALTELHCNCNKLKRLNISKNTALVELVCEENKLKRLDISKNTALVYLFCSFNRLKKLDVSRNIKLTHLYCKHNRIKSLDMSGCSALTKLYCEYNQLKSLDVSECTALAELVCSDNQITSLDVSTNAKLTLLYFQMDFRKGQLTSSALNALFETLPGNQGIIRIKNHPGTKSCDRSIATDKGWTFERE